MKKTVLNETHQALGAKMIDFSGWSMPLHYGSQITEHNAVRDSVGLFDVSHMSVFDFIGKDQDAYFRRLLANDIQKINAQKKSLYSLVVNESGGIIDDLIVYKLDDRYRIVSNSATMAKNEAWFKQNIKSFDVGIKRREDLSILALQGPQAVESFNQLGILEPVTFERMGHASDQSIMVSRSGYTGEDGLELILPDHAVAETWQRLIAMNIQPIGLGARDSLRIEAGFNLYGVDMDETNHPFESNLGWSIDFRDPERNFIGKDALLNIDAKSCRQLLGVIVKGKGMLRTGQKIKYPNGSGEVLCGTFSPLINASIGYARIDRGYAHNGLVSIRDKHTEVEFVALPFIRNGRVVF